MIKQKLTILAATLAVAASITTSQAALITGGISFFGGANFTPTGANNVQSVTFNNVIAFGGSGAFAAINLTPATFTAATWNLNTSTAIPNFWSVNDGTDTFTFALLSSTIVQQASGFVSVSGAGIVTATGPISYSATGINWNFSSQDPAVDGKFTFSASASTVPEPSTVVAGALLLLPFGISTVRILRKNKNA